MENPLFRTKNKERNLSKLIFSKKEKKKSSNIQNK